MSGDLAVLARGALAYGLSSVLQRAYTILLLPILLIALTPEDFGILAITDLVSLMLVSSAGACLDRACTRQFHTWPADGRRGAVAAVWAAAVLVALSVGMLLLVAGPILFGALVTGVPFAPYLQLAIVSGVARSTAMVPRMALRADERARAFAATSVLNAVTGGALIVALVVGARLGVVGVLAALVANDVAWAVGWAAWTLRGRPRIAWEAVRPALRFSLPLVPGDLVTTLGSGIDRVLLQALVPLEQLGIYSIAQRVARLLLEANQALKNAWIPRIVRGAVEEGRAARAMVRRLGPAYLLALGVAIWVAAAVLLRVIEPETYGPAVAYVPWLLAGYLGAAAYVVLLPLLYLADRTALVSALGALGLATTLAVGLAAIPALGVWGAVAAVIAGNWTVAGAALVAVRSRPSPAAPAAARLALADTEAE